MRTLLDALIIFASMAIAVRIKWHTSIFVMPWLYPQGPLTNLKAWKLLAAFGGFAVLLLWTSSHHYESASRKRSLLREQKLNLEDCAISGLFLVSALYLLGADAPSRGFVLLFVLLVAFGLGIRRLIYRTFPKDPSGPRNVLIIGVDSIALALRDQLREDPELGYTFKGFVKLSNSEANTMADPDEIVGTIDKLAEHVCNYSVNEVFLTDSCGRETALTLVDQAHELGIGACLVPGHLRFGVNPRNRLRI
ncbi:MAG TPA: hypothetical protein VGS10_07350 [Terracidiphilus sp.]|nr:hypothetical protein [Terracidiphilus sp.]